VETSVQNGGKFLSQLFISRDLKNHEARSSISSQVYSLLAN